MPVYVPLIVLAAAAVVVAMTVAAARGRLGVNGFAGVRTARVMASPEAWRAGHRAALAPITIGCALAVIAVSVPVVLPLPDGLETVAVIVSTVSLLAGAMVGMVRADHAASAVTARQG